MCVTCGCSDGATPSLTMVGDQPHPHDLHTHEHGDQPHTHVHPDGTVIIHSHAAQGEGGRSPSRSDAASTHANLHGTVLTLEEKVLARNDLIAAQNRGWFKGRNILALNLLSSPGSGKTTLLTRTIHDLQARRPISVIEGDQATANDAERIRSTGCPVLQINTGTGCHLDASMIERGLNTLNPPLDSIVMIENVGNLVCPALFDLGEAAKVVILSVTEGEDKPIKYPHMFRAGQVLILNKIDLLPYVSFDVDRCLTYAHQVNPDLTVFQLSATTGAGLEGWYDWLLAQSVQQEISHR